MAEELGFKIGADTKEAEQKIKKLGEDVKAVAKSAEGATKKMSDGIKKSGAFTARLNPERLAALRSKYATKPQVGNYTAISERNKKGILKANLSPEMQWGLHYNDPKKFGKYSATASMHNFRKEGLAPSDAELEKKRRSEEREKERAAKAQAAIEARMAKEKERAEKAAERERLRVAKEEEKLQARQQREAERAARESEKAKARQQREAERAARAEAKAKEQAEKEAAKKMQASLKNINGAFGKLFPENKFGELAKNLSGKLINTFGIEKAEKFAAVLGKVSAKFLAVKAAARGIAKISPFAGLSRTLQDAYKRLSQFGRTLKRIVMVKAIRAAISSVVRGWKEGLTNLYNYSARFGTVFKGNMDSIATDLQYVRNGMAAMVAPIINVITPAVMRLAQAFVDLANAAGLFFAKITGQASFSAAIRGAKAFQDMSGAAKEAKKQLMGFDELNVLTAPSGGSGTAADYGKMFEEWSTAIEPGSIEERIKMAIENGNWNALGIALADKMNEVVENFGNSGFGERIGQKIQNALTTAVAFMQRFDFSNAGAALGKNLNGLLSKIDFNKFGKFLAQGITGAFDFVVGFIKGTDFKLVGDAIGGTITGWFDHFSQWLDQVNWGEIGKTFFTKVCDFVSGINFGEVARSFFHLFGSALSAAWDLGLGLFDGIATKVSEYFQGKTDECGGNAVLGFLKGVLDGLIGIVSWVYDNIVHPFIYGLTNGFGFNNGDGGEMGTIGKDIIDGLFKGLTKAWTTISTWVTEKIDWFKQKFRGLRDWLFNEDGTNTWTPSQENRSLLFRAEGGTVPTGQLFIANEAGPELVGSVGGKTTVTSQDQFTAGMADIMDVTNTVILQAAQALMQTIQNKDMTAVAVIGDRQIVSAYDRGKTLAGGALVK